MKSWVEISKQRLSDNYKILTAAAGDGTGVLAVVKANAYGHGVGVCAPVLAQAGVEWLGVTDVAEGCAVREALGAGGIAQAEQPAILVMSGMLADETDAAIKLGLTPVVWDRQQMEWLVESAERLGSTGPIAVHIEIDTGMARQGITPGEELRKLLHWIKTQPGLYLEGVMTHFASAEEAESQQTHKQRGLFEQTIDAVTAAGLEPRWVHAGNSSTVDNQDSDESLPWLRQLAAAIGARSMVRSGVALYGYCLPIEKSPKPPPSSDSPPMPTVEDVSPASSAVRHSVRRDILPVMAWKTRVIGVREVKPGDTVGYNARFRVIRPMRLALLPVGYADGLRRELSGQEGHTGGWVLVRERRAAIVGRVSMNLTMVDVTGITGVEVGDEAVVLGDGITADDHARLANTICYEILCGMRASSCLV